MKRLLSMVRHFLDAEDGPTTVEYAVMLSLIIVACFSAISIIGDNASIIFSNVANALAQGYTGGDVAAPVAGP